jgi:hypothetical protein
MAKNRTYDDKMKLEMPFAEALGRFLGTEPDELPANIIKSRKKSKKREPPSDGQLGAGSIPTKESPERVQVGERGSSIAPKNR